MYLGMKKELRDMVVSAPFTTVQPHLKQDSSQFKRQARLLKDQSPQTL
jgi:hypothetical protein